MDLNFTAAQLEQIVAILTKWHITETIDQDECTNKLLNMSLDAEIVDWIMDVTNVVTIDQIGIEQHLLNEIEEYNTMFENFDDEDSDPYQDYLKHDCGV